MMMPLSQSRSLNSTAGVVLHEHGLGTIKQLKLNLV